MRILAVVLLLLAVSCAGENEAPPPPDLDRDDLMSATIDTKTIGGGWAPKENPGPNTVQIGGRVGAANIRPVVAEATSAYDEKDGDGYVSNTLLVLRSEDVARAVIAAHEEGARTTSWTQDRDDGGKAAFSFSGAVQQLPNLGDEMFAARLKVIVTNAAGNEFEQAVEYVSFSLGPIIAFVVALDARAAVVARRLEARVARLLS